MRLIGTLLVVSFLFNPALGHADDGGEYLASAAAVVAFPQADADEFSDTSIGFRGTFGYRVHPYVRALGSVDLIPVNENEFADEATILFYSVSVGARLSSPAPKALKPFGELLLGRHTVSVNTDGGDDTDSDIGFRLGGGVEYGLGPLRGVASITYSSADIDGTDIAALVVEAGASWRF